MEVGVQLHATEALPPGETRYPFYRILSEPHGRSGQVRKTSPQPGFDPRTVKSVASRYNVWAIPAHRYSVVPVNFSVLAITLHSSVGTIFDHYETKYSSFHDVITEVDSNSNDKVGWKMSDPLVGTRSAPHLKTEVRGCFCPHSVPGEKFIGTGARTDYSALGRNFS